MAQAGVVGFGVGEKGDYHFEDLRIDAPSVTPVTVALRYHYDVQGRVVGRTLNPGTPEEQSLFYLCDGARIAEQVDGDGDLVAAWDYGPYIDEPVAMHRDTNGDGILDATWYYLHDDLYNVVGLVDAATDGVVERYSYDDYGMPTVWVEDAQNPGAWIEHTTANGSPASAIGNPFMFTGRRWDPQLRLYDYRTRYYDPALGRFLRLDTIGLYGDPNNLGNPYTYVGNNPWTHTDPWGQWGWDDDWVETSLSIFTGGLVGQGGSAAAHSFWVESGGEQLRGMANGAAALFDKEARSQFHDDNAQRFYERIMMQHTEGEDIEDAISSATGFGMLTSDFVGTTQIMEAYDALDYSTGDSLEGVERTQRGLIGASQLVATSAAVGRVATATNSASSRLVGSTTNSTIARGAGLATTRVGPGFGARAATRMRVAGNLAGSRAGNAASSFPVRTVQTPYGTAVQGQSAAALSARADVQAGARLYRTGTLGVSDAGEAQFWALESPNMPGFASRYGIPPGNVAAADMVESGVLRPGSTFVTRVAPGVGSNAGGGIEVVTPRNGVQLHWLSGGH